MPGDDLLFQRLSVSTIGAVRFHGRVRDGIGWVTVAKVTKQYEAQGIDAVYGSMLLYLASFIAVINGLRMCRFDIDGGILKA